METSFETPEPIVLYVELPSGDLRVRAEDVTETTIDVEGPDAEDVTVEQRGEQIVVIAPHRRGSIFRDGELIVTASIPTDSELVTKLGSADVTAQGRYASARIKTGSGDVRVDELTGSSSISTGSGDVSLGTTRAVMQVKSGSGDVDVRDAHDDLELSTASGDVNVAAFHQGSLAARCVSGDLQVGVPADTPVWTDITTVSGDVTSSLRGAGQPEDGQPFIELRATTVSGDINLVQL